VTRHRRQLALAFVAALPTLAGCGSTRPRLAPSRPWQVGVEQATRPPAPIPVSVPVVEGPRAETAEIADPRLHEKVTLRSEATDLRALLLGLSKQTGINIVLDEEVSGTVSAYLNEVEVLDALRRIVAPLGFEIDVTENFVRVYEPVVESRMYRVQYLRGERSGQTQVAMIDRSSAGGQAGGAGGGSGGGGGGAAGGGGGGAGGSGGGAAASGGPGGLSLTQIKSTFTVRFWQDLSSELESLVFDGAEADDLVRADRGDAGISIYEKAKSKKDEKKEENGQGGPGPAPAVTAAQLAAQQQAAQAAARRARKHVGRSLTVNSMSGTIVVRAKPRVLDAIGRYLSAVEDTVQRQVIVDIRILEVALSDKLRVGVEGKNIPFLPSDVLGGMGLTGGVTTQQGVPDGTKSVGENIADQTLLATPGASNLKANGMGSLWPAVPSFTLHLGSAESPGWNTVVQLLSTLGDVRTVAAPRVSALHNQKAVVKVVRDRVFYLLQAGTTSQGVAGQATTGPQYNAVVVPEGIVVDVTPLIGDDGTVTLEVHPSYSVIFNEKAAPGGAGSQPEVDRRELQTTVRVKGEQTVMLGGLVTERTDRRETGIPLLKDIPYLGGLFRRTEEQTEKAELIILLTPRVQGPVALKEYMESLVQADGGKHPVVPEPAPAAPAPAPAPAPDAAPAAPAEPPPAGGAPSGG